MLISTTFLQILTIWSLGLPKPVFGVLTNFLINPLLKNANFNNFSSNPDRLESRAPKTRVWCADQFCINPLFKNAHFNNFSSNPDHLESRAPKTRVWCADQFFNKSLT